MNLHNMSDAELLALIAEAAQTLRGRAGALPVSSAAQPLTATARDPRIAALISAPDEADQDFCLMLAARIRGGGYVKAHERERVAAIAQDYPAWVRRQGLPTVHNAGEWQRSIAMASAPRAKAR